MASESPKRVLVFGSTGVIGKFIIQEVVEAKFSFDKIGLFTSPETAKSKTEEINGWKQKGVEIIVGDIKSEDDVKKAYEGIIRTSPSDRMRILSTVMQDMTPSSQLSAATPFWLRYLSSNLPRHLQALSISTLRNTAQTSNMAPLLCTKSLIS